MHQEVQRRLKPVRTVEMMLEHKEELMAAEKNFKIVLFYFRAQFQAFKKGALNSLVDSTKQILRDFYGSN
jgi:hypothetical protein